MESGGGGRDSRKKDWRISFSLTSTHVGEEGEQCRSKRHCFGVFFEEKEMNLGITQK